jgi:hypothetical protein
MEDELTISPLKGAERKKISQWLILARSQTAVEVLWWG